MAAAASESVPETPSYVDFAALLSPEFSPHAFANAVITNTNNPSDPPPLDLTTPLSRVLFDVQEIDTHIHNLTTKSALPILTYTKDQSDAAQRVLQGVEGEVGKLSESYKRLETEILGRYAAAKEAKLGAERSWEVLRLGRGVQRIVTLARQLEGLMADSQLGAPGKAEMEDHRVLVRAAYVILAVKELMLGEEGTELGRVNVVKGLQAGVFGPSEDSLRTWGGKVVREFSMSNLSTGTPGQGEAVSGPTFAQTEDAKARTASATQVLYLLSPVSPAAAKAQSAVDFQPELLLKALTMYLQTALTSSAAAIARALATLPTLERTLLEVSARCQNIVALETLLLGIKPPAHPYFPESSVFPASKGARSSSEEANLLQPLLQALDTSSLASFFWRSLASSLSSRVQDILNKGGVSARTLRSNKDRVRDEIRGCVLRGSQLPRGLTNKGQSMVVGNWEREAAVMMGSIVGLLGR